MKANGSGASFETMAFKLMEVPKVCWRKLSDLSLLPEVICGAKFINRQSVSESAACPDA
jgi:hypothetical protein